MVHHTITTLAMSAALGTTPGASTAPGAGQDTTVEKLQERLAAVESELAAIKSQDCEYWLTEQRATEIRSLVQDVLADADMRASMLQSGMTAGYDKGFFLASTDGHFKLKLSGQMQIRYVYNWRDDAADDSNRQGFEIRRAKLTFAGNILDPSWTYEFTGACNRDGGAFGLENAFVNKDLGQGWDLQFGQFKPPFLREESVSSKRQLAVERSLVNEEFNQDFAQGVQVGWEGDHFRLMAMYHDGFASRNIGWQVEDTEWGALTGRVEWLSGGDWKAMDDFAGWKDSDLQILVGGAANYQKSEFGTGSNLPPPDFDNNEVGMFSATVDATLKGNSFGVFGACVYRSLDPEVGDSIDQWGFVVQGSLFFTEDIEGFARYEFGDADSDSIEDLSIITVGVNKYWAKHSLKWQNDVGFGLDEVASFWATSSTGWLTDNSGDEGQIVFRSQFQLLF